MPKQKKIVNIGVGEMFTSQDEELVLRTYALGSCTAIIIYDKAIKLGSMIHVALPDSSVKPEKAEDFPGYFADTGVPQLIQKMKEAGARKKSTWIKLVGGANVMDPNGVFNIGKRNVLTIKKILWKYNMGIIAEDTGGDISRTVSLYIENGLTIVKSGSKEWEI